MKKRISLPPTKPVNVPARALGTKIFAPKVLDAEKRYSRKGRSVGTTPAEQRTERDQGTDGEE